MNTSERYGELSGEHLDGVELSALGQAHALYKFFVFHDPFGGGAMHRERQRRAMRTIIVDVGAFEFVRDTLGRFVVLEAVRNLVEVQSFVEIFHGVTCPLLGCSRTR